MQNVLKAILCANNKELTEGAVASKIVIKSGLIGGVNSTITRIAFTANEKPRV